MLVLEKRDLESGVVQTEVMKGRSGMKKYVYKPIGGMFSEEYTKMYKDEKWKGVLHVQTRPKALDVLDHHIRSALGYWVGPLSIIVFEYLSNEEWATLDTVTLKVDLKTMQERLEKGGQDTFDLDVRRQLVEMVHRKPPHFFQTAFEYQKYKRSVIQVLTPEEERNLLPNSTFRKALQRVIRTPLHYYQERTVLWAQRIEIDVRKSVSFAVPTYAHKPKGYENSSVAFCRWNNIITLDSDPLIKNMKVSYKGGVLANEMGLGKSLTMITVTMLEHAENELFRYEVKSQPTVSILHNKRLRTMATLVVCPAHLCKQWEDQINFHLTQAIGWKTKVLTLTTMRNFKHLSVMDILEADVIIMSVTFLTNKAYIKMFDLKTPKEERKSIQAESKEEKEELLNQQFETRLSSIIEKKAEMYDRDRKHNGPMLEAFHFKRILLDEAHEIFEKDALSEQSTSCFFRRMMNVRSTIRWIISGTPFPDEFFSPRSVLRFLGINVNGLTLNDIEPSDRMVVNWCKKTGKEAKEYPGSILRSRFGQVFDDLLFQRLFSRYRRRNVVNAYKVPTYDEEIVLLPMHPIERYLYDLIQSEEKNKSRKKLNLAQICAHPLVSKKLAAEVNKGLQNDRYLSWPRRLTLGNILRGQTLHLRMLIKEEERLIKKNQSEVTTMEKVLKGGKYVKGRQVTLEEDERAFLMRVYARTMRAVDKSEVKLENLKPIYQKFFKLGLVYTELARLEARRQKAEERFWSANPDNRRAEYTFLRHRDRERQLRRSMSEKRGRKVSWQEFRTIHAPDEKDLGLRENLYNYYMQVRDDDNYSDEEDDALPKISLVAEYNLEAEKFFPDNRAVLNHGTKTAYVIGRIKMIIQDPKAKIILFSSWNRLFEELEEALRAYQIKFVVCKGNIHVRQMAITKFNHKHGEYRVIMLSLQNAASGSNLQEASHVIMMDPPRGSMEEAEAIESQAIGRAHRQGQTKKLQVIRLAMERTIEEELLRRKILSADLKESTADFVSSAYDAKGSLGMTPGSQEQAMELEEPSITSRTIRNMSEEPDLLPPGWRKYQDRNGRPYYVHSTNGFMQWERPRR